MRNKFQIPLLSWYDVHGRKNLPWKFPKDAYKIWLSEIMLQQTQVKTVLPYFNRFIERYPDIQSLASASEDEVLALWSGLGYYSRGRNLHKTAQIIVEQFQGKFPEDMGILIKLPGIGLSTAAAITSQAFNQPTAILDGNVKRVLSRYFMIEGVSTKTTQTLWVYANLCMSHERPADYTQAIMDLGATCCTSKNPNCGNCPLQSTCLARINDVVSLYPTKKQKKSIPIKHQQFLLMHNQEGSIYLEKQPPAGLWGGLWCPPSIDNAVNAEFYIKTNFPLNIISINPLMTIKHTFSHFRLVIYALSIGTTLNNDVIFESTGRWFSHAETLKLGIAKPITDMIQQFFQLGN